VKNILVSDSFTRLQVSLSLFYTGIAGVMRERMGVADKEEVVKRCVEMLEEIISDITVPRNLRRSTDEIDRSIK
jgi:hypothetical protein